MRLYLCFNYAPIAYHKLNEEKLVTHYLSWLDIVSHSSYTYYSKMNIIFQIAIIINNAMIRKSYNLLFFYFITKQNQ